MPISEPCRQALELVGDRMRAARARQEYYETEPGTELLARCPDILRELSPGVRSVVVTGTNGKTTTCRMISSVFQEAGIGHFSNPEGANLTNRITTLFCENYLFGGNDTAVLECDEGHLGDVLPKISAACLVITNIFPDQLSRFESEEHVADLICDAMARSAPSVCILSRRCHFYEKLRAVPGWEFVDYETMGETPSLPIPGSFNRFNALAAKAVGRLWGLRESAILSGLEKTRQAYGRFESFEAPCGRVTVCLAKNPEGFRVIADWLQNETHAPYDRLVLAVNRNPGDDQSTGWLKENDYSPLSTLFERILVTGNCAADLADLVARAGGAPEDVPLQSLAAPLSPLSNTLIIANYSAMMTVRKLFAELGCIPDYWETCFPDLKIWGDFSRSQ